MHQVTNQNSYYSHTVVSYQGILGMCININVQVKNFYENHVNLKGRFAASFEFHNLVKVVLCLLCKHIKQMSPDIWLIYQSSAIVLYISFRVLFNQG